MLKAIEVNLKNLDIIAETIKRPRRDVNSFYETNTYIGVTQYFVIGLDGETLTETRVVSKDLFQEDYMFVTAEDNTKFIEVIKI